MNRTLSYALGLTGVLWIPLSALPPEWKNYSNSLVGIEVRVRRAWHLVEVKESPQTGMVVFTMTQRPDPLISLTIQRQRVAYPLEVHTSPEILNQLYEPGYRISSATLAGRKSVKVEGTSKDDQRRQEGYYSAQPPFIDEIVFAAPTNEWDATTPLFNQIKETIRWTR